jgi:hypothetical protein
VQRSVEAGARICLEFIAAGLKPRLEVVAAGAKPCLEVVQASRHFASRGQLDIHEGFELLSKHIPDLF